MGTARRLIGRTLLLTIAIVITGSLAQAEVVYSNKDWSLRDNGTFCTATTAVRVQRKVYSLKLVMDKAGDLPVQLFIDPHKHTPSVSAFYFDMGNETYYFTPVDVNEFDIASSSPVTYWGVPVDTQKIVSFIRAKLNLGVRSVDNNQVYPFSLRGSTATINQLVSRCGQDSLYTAEDFEQLFLNASNKSINVSAMNESIAIRLRDLLIQGVQDYEQVLVAQDELDQLEAKYAQWTSELKTLNSDISNIENNRLPYLNSEKINAQNTINQATRDKAQFENLLQQERRKLTVAQQELQQAQNNIAPHRPEHDRLRNRVRRLNNEVSRLENDLASINSQINRAERRLQNLRRELQQVRQRLQQRRQERRQLEQDLNRAQQNLNAFNPQAEIQRRKQNNSELQQVRQRIQRLKNQVSNQEQAVQRAQNKRDRKKNRLDQCLEKKKNNPDKNCQKQRQELRQARQELQNAKSQLQDTRQKLQRNQNRRRQIVRQIENEVEREHQALRRRVNNLQNQLDDVDRRIQRLRREKQSLEGQEIPNQEHQLNRLYNQRSITQQDLQNARNNRDQAVRDYNNFKASTNYDFLESEVRRAQAKVNAIQDQISRYQADIRRQERIIRDQTNYKNQLISDIASAEQTLVAKKKRRDEVVVLLQPYEKEKAPLVANLEAAMKVLKATSAQYTQTLP